MGGSGGGGGGGSYTPPRTKSSSCEELEFSTHLSSPVVEVLKSIEVGDELEITLSASGTACVAIFEGKIAGSILGANLIQLINCIKAGNRFIAVVTTIDGARCVVTVVHESAL